MGGWIMFLCFLRGREPPTRTGLDTPAGEVLIENENPEKFKERNLVAKWTTENHMKETE